LKSPILLGVITNISILFLFGWLETVFYAQFDADPHNNSVFCSYYIM